ncbi:energy transducer TonB [Hymenobacter metallilatus]|uniref:Energy transducer TonB n=1 Tax=Hymenobacter metallilatus TaxID=2493666 RepID=A0A3R9P7I5_9BACT|nr:energy transducer TonB [Hymenobacter metallilatus]RSK30137.1 energy transducer TonB [Hymenobacter metallilatus]
MTTATRTPLPSLDDIVFEGRNKAYGAYVLRQMYGQHVTKAVGIATALAVLLIAVPLAIQHFFPDATGTTMGKALPEKPINELADVVIDQVTHTHPPVAATVVVRPPALLPPKVVPNEQVTAEPTEIITAPVVDGPVVIGPVAQAGEGGLVAGGAGKGTDTVTQPATPAVVEPFLHVEEMPEFAGGQAALMKYLQRQLHYPSQALRNGVEGKVFISFTVNADGSIQDVSVLKGLGFGTDEEASRVIRQMPAWKPGYQNHHAVPVRYTLPITFKYE